MLRGSIETMADLSEVERMRRSKVGSFPAGLLEEMMDGRKKEKGFPEG